MAAAAATTWQTFTENNAIKTSALRIKYVFDTKRSHQQVHRGGQDKEKRKEIKKTTTANESNVCNMRENTRATKQATGQVDEEKMCFSWLAVLLSVEFE